MLYVFAHIQGLTDPKHSKFANKILRVANARAKELNMKLVN